MYLYLSLYVYLMKGINLAGHRYLYTYHRVTHLDGCAHYMKILLPCLPFFPVSSFPTWESAVE